MKKEVKQMAKEYGCTTHYSGNTKTMFVVGAKAKQAALAIKNYMYVSFTITPQLWLGSSQ